MDLHPRQQPGQWRVQHHRQGGRCQQQPERSVEHLHLHARIERGTFGQPDAAEQCVHHGRSAARSGGVGQPAGLDTGQQHHLDVHLEVHRCDQVDHTERSRFNGDQWHPSGRNADRCAFDQDHGQWCRLLHRVDCQGPDTHHRGQHHSTDRGRQELHQRNRHCRFGRRGHAGLWCADCASGDSHHHH